jgi:hypothetical protein
MKLRHLGAAKLILGRGLGAVGERRVVEDDPRAAADVEQRGDNVRLAQLDRAGLSGSCA